MQDGIEKSRHALLVITPRWLESEWTLYESILMSTDDPAGLQRRVIPLLLEKCTPPKFISMRTWVDLTNQDREKEAWENLFKSLDVSSPTLVEEKPASGGLPPGSYVPFIRNANFTGRTEDLDQLAENLLKENATNTVISQAVTGMDGLGKTQLAVEFAWRYGHCFKGVHWLDLRDPQALDAAIALCGNKMGYTQVDQRDLIASTIKNWIEDGPRLLILDNLEDVAHTNEVLVRFQHPSMRVLITSRRSDFPEESDLLVQELGLFTEAECLAFLEKTLKQKGTAEARKALIETLGRLPLALELAAKYINIAKTGIDEYLQKLADLSRLEAEQVRRFARLQVSNPTKHDQSLFDTFQLSWQEVQEEAEQKIFMIAGYCAPNVPIPLEIFKDTLELEEEDLNFALYRLDILGLLSDVNDFPSIHPLLAAYARTLSSKELLEKLTSKLAVLADQANKQVAKTGSLGWFVLLRPHVRSTGGFAEEKSAQDAGYLLNELGYSLLKIADYPGARDAYERALKIDEATYGPDHPEVARDVNNLGSVLQDLGDLAGAKAAFERALRVFKQFLLEGHPNIRIAQGNPDAVSERE